MSDDWFNTISETAYTGVDATALEMLTYVFEWTYTYKDWLKIARKIQKGKDEDLEDISKAWSDDTKTVLIDPENPKTLREMMRLSGILSYLCSMETFRQVDREEALGTDNVTVRVRRKTYRLGKIFKFEWGKEVRFTDKD